MFDVWRCGDCGGVAVFGGTFSVDRGVFDHPLFRGEPYSQREAWLWILAEAAFKPTRARFGRLTVPLQRGQFVHSLRFMARAWGWSPERVRRFVALLIAENMLNTGTVTGTRQLARHFARVLSVCNYDEYQMEVGVERDTKHQKTRQRRIRKKKLLLRAPTGDRRRAGDRGAHHF